MNRRMTRGVIRRTSVRGPALIKSQTLQLHSRLTQQRQFMNLSQRRKTGILKLSNDMRSRNQLEKERLRRRSESEKPSIIEAEEHLITEFKTTSSGQAPTLHKTSSINDSVLQNAEEDEKKQLDSSEFRPIVEEITEEEKTEYVSGLPTLRGTETPALYPLQS